MKLDYNKVISQKMDDYDDDEYKKLKEDKRREDRRNMEDLSGFIISGIYT